jgi:hypothetical protein
VPSKPVRNPSGLARVAETLASLIPGYSGYKSRELAREDDRAVRDAVVRRLSIVVGRVERALAACIRALPSEHVEDADRALRALKREGDRIRFAPQGYTSLFGRRETGARELNALLALDAGLWAAIEELDRVAAAWEEDVRVGGASWPAEALRSAVFELEDALDERESYLRS